MANSKEKRLTLKQRKWIKEYIDTGNATEAASRVYNCKNRDVARNIGGENLAKLSFPELMEEMGLTNVALLNIGTKGMTKAKKIHGTGDNFVETPDYATRHRYWDTMLKLKGRLQTGIQVNTQLNVEKVYVKLPERKSIEIDK